MNKLSCVSPRPYLTFQGKAANKAIAENRQGPLSDKDLFAILKDDDSPYVKTCQQAPFLNKGGALETILTKYLDNLVTRLRAGQLKPNLLEKTCQLLLPTPKNQLFKQLDEHLNLYELGSGRNGTVYHVNLADKSYALKLFSKGNRQAFYETAIGAYFSCQSTKNLSKLYVANPQEGWMLMEYIDDAIAQSERPGKTIFEHGFYIDDASSENFIQRVRIDYGGNVYPLEEGKRGLSLRGGQYMNYGV